MPPGFQLLSVFQLSVVSLFHVNGCDSRLRSPKETDRSQQNAGQAKEDIRNTTGRRRWSEKAQRVNNWLVSQVSRLLANDRLYHLAEALARSSRSGPRTPSFSARYYLLR